MKVLIITASLNERSGWGRHTRAIVDELRMQGTEVVICSEDVGLGVPYPVHALLPLSSRFGAWFFVRNILQVRKIARSVSVVHALDGWPLGVYGWAAVVGSRKPLFINGVGTYSVAPLYAWGKKWLMRYVYQRAQKVFCISVYTMNQMVEAGVSREKMLVVHFGTPVPVIPSVEEVRAYRTKYSIQSDRYPIVLTVGAIKNRKGQFDTLRAIEILKKPYPGILYIAAGAPQSAYIEKMETYAKEHEMSHNLLIINDADDGVINFLYSICSVFALNSNTDDQHHHFEGFGAVITEAYRFGVPAVGSSNSGIEDAIEDGRTGYLSRQGDAEDIAQNIKNVLQNHEVLSEQARRAGFLFSWEKTIKTYMQYYKNEDDNK